MGWMERILAAIGICATPNIMCGLRLTTTFEPMPGGQKAMAA